MSSMADLGVPVGLPGRDKMNAVRETASVVLGIRTAVSHVDERTKRGSEARRT